MCELILSQSQRARAPECGLSSVKESDQKGIGLRTAVPTSSSTLLFSTVVINQISGDPLSPDFKAKKCDTRATPLLEDGRPSPTRIAKWSLIGEEEDEVSPPVLLFHAGPRDDNGDVPS